MHFELLVEDQSGKKMLEIIVPKIIGTNHTHAIHSYKGIGRIPRNMRDTENASNRILLENLPKLLKGYGKTFDAYPADYCAAVILVCDLDENCFRKFKRQLDAILENCDPRPLTRFCIAIEEGESWFLGDFQAIRAAFPNARGKPLASYENDSICGTWEKLADAIFPGGSVSLSKLGYQEIGKQKSIWAERITPHMNIDANRSESFNYFRRKISELTQNE